MHVFKFGGASVKDADGVRNLTEILLRYKSQPLTVVLSAMGKTTNQFESVWSLFCEGRDYLDELQQIKRQHLELAADLFGNNAKEVNDLVEELFFDTECYLEKEDCSDRDCVYDQLIPLGELLSTKIVHKYLKQQGMPIRWMDARNFIITKNIHREAKLEWDITLPLIRKKLMPLLEHTSILTQGFIGSTTDNITTTLGREGSDFTASIFGFALDATEVTVWKDVPGVLNADPVHFKDAVKFDELSYEDAIEMSYYGARVLHPKTIKPLQNKNIPLKVRSFLHPEDHGTLIHSGAPSHQMRPTLILKENQVLFSIATKDYSFIAEENLSRIFEVMARYRIKTNVMQNSAISFSFCTDQMQSKTEGFMRELEHEYHVEKQENLELITIRPYEAEWAAKLLNNRKIVLEQKNIRTLQVVVE